MTIDEFNNLPVDSGDQKEEIVSGTTQSLGDSLSSEMLEEYNKLNTDIIPNVVKIREMRDNTNYQTKDVLIKMLEFVKEFGYTDVKIFDKNIDDNGNLVSISLEGKSPKYGGCYTKLSFTRNCSYGEKSGFDETRIVEECYDDDSFSEPFDAEIIYNY